MICTGPNGRMEEHRGRWPLLILAALLATVLVVAGCAGGSGGSAQPSGQKKQQASEGRLGHPALGSADAPVVLTEYSDYQ